MFPDIVGNNKHAQYLTVNKSIMVYCINGQMSLMAQQRCHRLGIIPVVVNGMNGNSCKTYALLDDGAEKRCVILFDLILYVHSTIFQLCGTGLPGLSQY